MRKSVAVGVSLPLLSIALACSSSDDNSNVDAVAGASNSAAASGRSNTAGAAPSSRGGAAGTANGGSAPGGARNDGGAGNTGGASGAAAGGATGGAGEKAGSTGGGAAGASTSGAGTSGAGTSGAGTSGAGMSGAGTSGAGGSAGAPFKEAAHPAFPVLADRGAPVLTAPQVVTVTFPKDSNVADLENFGATVASGPWWDAMRAGYCGTSSTQCIGRGPRGTNVRLTTAPASSYTDSKDPAGTSSVRQLLTSKIKSGALPTPTTQTAFVLYLPSSTKIKIDNGTTSCSDFVSYHSWTTYGGVQFPYVVVSECPVTAPVTLLAATTINAGYQIANTATNPFATDTTAGIALDGGDASVVPWYKWSGNYEVAGLCTDYSGVGQDIVKDQGFSVPRIWNALQAAAGHDPCAPLPSNQAYLNAGSEKWLGITTVGGTVTFNADAFSDAPISGGWSLSGLDLFASSPNEFLTIKFGNATSVTVNNGDKVQVSVKLNKDPGPGGAVGVLVSKTGPANAPTAEHEWPFLIGTAADELGAADGIAKF